MSTRYTGARRSRSSNLDLFPVLWNLGVIVAIGAVGFAVVDFLLQIAVPCLILFIAMCIPAYALSLVRWIHMKLSGY